MRELYADDLAILGNSWEDVSQKYARSEMERSFQALEAEV